MVRVTCIMAAWALRFGCRIIQSVDILDRKLPRRLLSTDLLVLQNVLIITEDISRLTGIPSPQEKEPLSGKTTWAQFSDLYRSYSVIQFVIFRVFPDLIGRRLRALSVILHRESSSSRSKDAILRDLQVCLNKAKGIRNSLRGYRS